MRHQKTGGRRQGAGCCCNIAAPLPKGCRAAATRPLSSDERGSTLVISLIILIILMLLGVTAMTTSDTQYKLAGNLQFEDTAMNSGETAISAAETWIAGSTGGVAHIRDAGFTTYNNGVSPQLYPAGYLTGLAAPGNDPLTMTWGNSNSADVSGDGSQRYIIELMSTDTRLVGSNQGVGGRASAGCNQVNTYRITARGTSARGATKFIQSYYSVLNC